MNPRIPYASEASRVVPDPGPAPGVLRGTGHSSFVIARRALTLVEMLIGMAITLLMMAAIVNLFANIGSGVRVRRAAMEMSGQLRMVRATLFNDLAGATCRALPWQRPDEDPGYIEIIEGVYSDKNPSALVPFASNTTLVPSSQINPLDGAGLGDYDDILALTVRNESAPFRGRIRNWKDPDQEGPEPFQWVSATIESNLAEIVWYAVENPDDADRSLGEPGLRTIYRRVLLVASWLPNSSKPWTITTIPPYTDQTMSYVEDNGTPGTTTVPGIASDNEVYRFCDVSFHREGNLRVPNTLGDLTKRENRFAHQINGTTFFPHVIDQTAIRVSSGNAFPTGSLSLLHPFGLPFEWDPADPDPLNPTIPPTPDREGTDVMLNNVLAFDVRLFDPGAPLSQSPTGSGVLEPSDAGWVNAAGTLVGYGAYVDLGWAPGFPVAGLAAGIPVAAFAEQRQAGWHPLYAGAAFDAGVSYAYADYPCVYGTWSFHYEHDGLDGSQDQDQSYVVDAKIRTQLQPYQPETIVDQGTNGLDDDGANGVDDILERETSPPYPVPLRGMQVKIRIYDLDTRQIREATVTRNFVPQ